MNRSERRKKESDLMKEYGINRKRAKQLVYLYEIREGVDFYVPDGAAVKLNGQRIASVQASKNKRYLQFVKEHVDTTFHVSRDDKRCSEKIVVLEVDESSPKWLWHVTDLIVVEKETEMRGG